MKEVEIFEGQRAEKYDEAIKVWIPAYDHIQEMIPLLLSHFLDRESSREVLVAGCGTGTEMEGIFKLSTGWKITGVDPSPEMTSQAVEKLKPYALSQNYEIITGRVEDLPLPNTFDAGTLILVSHFLADDGTKLALLKSIASRLKKNAPFILVDIFGTKESLIHNFSYLKTIFQHKGVPADLIEQGMKHIVNELHYVPEERMLELFSEAGFGKPHKFIQSLMFGGWVMEKR